MYFFAAASSSLISVYLALVRYFPTTLPYSFFIFLLSPAWHTLHLASLNTAFDSLALYFAFQAALNGGRADAFCRENPKATSTSTKHTQTSFIAILRILQSLIAAD